jgi:hypothetical protein
MYGWNISLSKRGLDFTSVFWNSLKIQSTQLDLMVELPLPLFINFNQVDMHK